MFPSHDRQRPYFPYSYKNDISGVTPYITGTYKAENNKKILKSWRITMDGKDRENYLDGEYYNTAEVFFRSDGSFYDGLYFYNFGLDTNPYSNQPNGAMNLIHFKHIEFEYKINEPPRDISQAILYPLILETQEENNSEKKKFIPFSYNKIN